MSEFKRIDILLTEKGFAASRTAAQRVLEAGRVKVNGKAVAKPSEKYDEDALIEVEESPQEEYVSRGAYKLIGALKDFGFSPAGMVCADIGASTGGFTQVLLKNGAAKVYAIDVGTDQLAPCLRMDPRVIVMEKCNARTLEKSMFDGDLQLVIYDVSFISATLIYPAIDAILAENGTVIGLIKPQFEAGKSAVGKNGIVRSVKDRENAILRCREAAAQNNLRMTALTVSPIHGGDGNVEFLCMLSRNGTEVTQEKVREIASKE